MVRLAAVPVILCLLAAPVGAQQKMWARPDEAGAWLPWEITCSPVQAHLQAAWEKNLQSIAALIRACPVFQEIRGYYPMLTGCVDGPGGTSGPYGGSLYLLLWPPETVERTPKGEPRVMKKWRYNYPGNGGGSLLILINAIGDLRDWFYGEDQEGKFYELPETTREVAGFPVVGKFLIVTPPGKGPLFVPIPQERAQRWIIDNLKRQAEADAGILAAARRDYEDYISPAGLARRAKTIEEAAASQRKPENQEQARRQAVAIDQRREADLKAAMTHKPGSPAERTLDRIAHLEARLASLSPEQRRQPAWYRRHPEGVRRLDYGDIVEAGTPGARPLVVHNPAFFDPKLPKAAMQLVSVPAAGYYDALAKRGKGEIKARVPKQLIEELDWRALAAMQK